MNRAPIEDRRVHRIERGFQLLHVIAFADLTGVIPLAVLPYEEMIIGQLRRLPRAHKSQVMPPNSRTG